MKSISKCFIVLFLFALFCGCKEEQKQPVQQTIEHTDDEKQFLQQYFEFVDTLKQKLKNDKDLLQVFIRGSRTQTEPQILSPDKSYSLGYGNNSQSDLDLVFFVKNKNTYDKYCNCDIWKKLFNINLCKSSNVPTDKCRVLFFNKNLLIDIFINNDNKIKHIALNNIYSYDNKQIIIGNKKTKYTSKMDVDYFYKNYIDSFYVSTIEILKLIAGYKKNISSFKQTRIEKTIIELNGILIALGNFYTGFNVNMSKNRNTYDTITKYSTTNKIKAIKLLVKQYNNTLDGFCKKENISLPNYVFETRKQIEDLFIAIEEQK